MRIVVLAGGLSMERNVSLSSGTRICRALRARGHQAALVDLYLGLEGYDGAPKIFSLLSFRLARTASRSGSSRATEKSPHRPSGASKMLSGAPS